MLEAAKDRIKQKPNEDICKNADVLIKDGAFCFKSLGLDIKVSLDDCSITPRIDAWHTLILLHYLSFSGGTPLKNKLMTFSEYKDGVIRGTRFDREVDAAVQKYAAKFSKDELIRRLSDMGAEIIPSNADICAKLYFLPRYPVFIKIWFADDEFPASGKMLIDKSANCYLPLEDAITAGDIILKKLFEE